MPLRTHLIELAIVAFFLAIGVVQTVVSQVRCRHDWIFERALYGDQINHSGGKRTVFRCSRCPRLSYCEELLEPLAHAPYLYDGLEPPLNRRSMASPGHVFAFLDAEKLADAWYVSGAKTRR